MLLTMVMAFLVQEPVVTRRAVLPDLVLLVLTWAVVVTVLVEMVTGIDKEGEDYYCLVSGRIRILLLLQRLLQRRRLIEEEDYKRKTDSVTHGLLNERHRHE